MGPTTDLDLSTNSVASLTSGDGVAAFFTALGYRTDVRKPLSAEAIGLAGDAAAPIREIELIAEDEDGFMRVVLVHLKSLTAKSRTDLTRVLGRTNVDHLLVLTSDYATLEFVLLDKRRRESRAPAGGQRIQVVPLVFAVDRKGVASKELRTLRRFTWTSRDGLEQFDKLRSVFEAAAFTEDYFCNRALFADHYLTTRLQEDSAWRESPAKPFQQVKDLLRDARANWYDKGEQIVRDNLYEPLFKLLGFKARRNKQANDDQTRPDYLLFVADAASVGTDAGSIRHERPISAAFTYAWDRWLDGPDYQLDRDTPDENPGACVVTALEEGIADWIIVTNGRQWRLYSRHAHSRATNFYEVDLPETLIASGDTDPNEAFRYWWLFFRAQAFQPVADAASVGSDAASIRRGKCWLDHIAEGSSDYAKELGERLKGRIFEQIFPHLARGFLEDRRQRLGVKQAPSDDDLRDVFQGTLTLLYRLLFLLYAESRDLLPVREAPYHAASLKRIKQEIADKAGIAQSDVAEQIKKAFSATETTIYDRLQRLFAVMDKGDAALNVPTYNGGLFMSHPVGQAASLSSLHERHAGSVPPQEPQEHAASLSPPVGQAASLSPPVEQAASLSPPVEHAASLSSPVGQAASLSPPHERHAGSVPPQEPQDSQGQEERELRIARFLAEHKVPDRALALAIDLLSRDEDPKTFSLVFIDYKSLAVRHLGSIYEGLLEFKLKIADEDLTTQTEKGKEKFIPLGQAKKKRGKSPDVVVRKGDVYLSNDKAERKASGSYYTPDPIVEYIVEQTVGPVLAEKLESLRKEFRKVRKTFDNEVQKATAFPVAKPAEQAARLSPPVEQAASLSSLHERHAGSVPPQEPQEQAARLSHRGESSLAGCSTHWEPREFALEKVYATHQDLVERLFEFRTLDPAMGSGHFLVETVDFITDRLLTFLNQFPINPVQVMLNRTRTNILAALTEQGVTVDPAKLTDVNLLKRHVLKRCIYGVDLNPMAVELAKVSLWLDAFTLGAPLSFLNHHLRCGNSLIGATFADLRNALQGRLFGVDYEPLLRAIRHVLFVNKMADATAAEVKQSASEYDQARRDLSGYQVVLDLLVAQHFGHPDAPDVLTHIGNELDLSSRARFEESLSEDDRQLVAHAASVARQPELRFFHWEIEFPEVFYGFEDADERRLKHKDEIAAGSAGFDAVIGNPPYVRQETIKPLKEYLKTCFETYDAANDLYVYFQEREIGLLQAGRRMGMIVSNKWMRAGYGEKIREYLKHVAQPVDLIDFGHTPIFPDADTFPCVLIAARRAVKIADVDDTDSFTACPIPRADWSPQMDLSAYCRRKRYTLPTRLMRRDVWSLEDPRIHALLEKIRNVGVPLKDIVGAPPLRGPVTGLNDAFYIDAATRERLIREDKRSAEIIRPLLRGRDIDRWRPREPNTFLILARRGIEIEQYPAIKRHLSQFRERLEPKPADWKPKSPGEKWPGRASGSYEWYELQASPADDSLAALAGPKIVYQEIQFHSWYGFDPGGSVVNNKVFLLPNATPALLGVLCSPLMWWFLTRTLPHMKDEALTPAGFLMEQLRISTGDSKTSHQIMATVERLMRNADATHALEAECCEAFRDEFHFDGDDVRIIDWLPLGEEVFTTRASALIESSPAGANQLSKFYRKYRARQVELLQARLKLEQHVATLVEDAYGLTPEERRLLRDTRPIRDPIDVLEAKIAGKAGVEQVLPDNEQ